MNKSHYFAELSEAYSAEIDDLFSDFEGKTVLSARLKDKRQEVGVLLQMIEAAPEMVLPIFYGAFNFPEPGVMNRAVRAEPDDEDFPAWDVLAASLRLNDWAKPIAEQVLAEPAGDRFMVSAAAVEYLRLKDGAGSASANDSAGEDRAEDGEESDRRASDRNESDDGDDQDLAEAGADWLAEQGFDSPNT